MSVEPAFHPPVTAGGPEAGTLVLRDGARVTMLRALPEDARRIGRFLRRLADRDRREVEHSLRLSSGEVAGFLQKIAGRGSGEAFVVQASEDEVVAFGSYRLLEASSSAAIAVAVDPERRQRGIASLLLEHLAVLAARRDVDRLVGVAHESNEALLELFRRGGFASREHSADGYVTLELSPRETTRDRSADAMQSRVVGVASLTPLFRPRNVAVVGASRDPASVGRRILGAMVSGGFNGAVFPVNPRASHVGSIRAHPSVAAIGEPIDLAVVAVPAEIVSSVVEDCASAGVRALIVISAGFAEIGGSGRDRQTRLLEQARRHGMRMVGPNCLGLLHTDSKIRLNASFAPHMPDPGVVALCSQSGALGIAIIALARRLGLGLSSFVSVGNKADVSGNDLLEYWEEDDATQVILFYLESFGNPRRFARICRRVGRAKPIVVVKAGRTTAGSRAAGSHTAALTSPDTAVDALFAQTGVLRADSLAEMFGLARALTSQPPPLGRSVAIATNAGGPAILCADALEAAGLTVDPLTPATQAALRKHLPAAASPQNPVDMIASAGPDAYRRCVESLLTAEEVDALVVIYTPAGLVATGAVGAAIGEAVDAGRQAGGHGKPVLACVVGEEEEVHQLRTPAGEVVPVFSFPEEIGRILAKVSSHAEWKRSDPGVFPALEDLDLAAVREVCRTASERHGPGWLGAEETRRLLTLAGLQLPRGGVAASPDDAVRIADSIGYPVAVKLASSQIVHKTELGAVRLDLQDAAEVRRAWAEIASRLEVIDRSEAMEGVLVQEMLTGTAEVMIGADQDPVFGAVVAFGLGGIHVEILRDVVFGVAPLTDRDAREMVRSIRGFRLLEGYRGHPAADVSALEAALLRVSRLADGVAEIAELDLNPIFALEPGRGYRVADARIRLAPPSST